MKGPASDHLMAAFLVTNGDRIEPERRGCCSARGTAGTTPRRRAEVM